jgi:hypothetical protein
MLSAISNVSGLWLTLKLYPASMLTMQAPGPETWKVRVLSDAHCKSVAHNSPERWGAVWPNAGHTADHTSNDAIISLPIRRPLFCFLGPKVVLQFSDSFFRKQGKVERTFPRHSMATTFIKGDIFPDPRQNWQGYATIDRSRARFLREDALRSQSNIGIHHEPGFGSFSAYGAAFCGSFHPL